MSMNPRILAIDDEQVILDSIIKLCSAEGWKVDPAIDAKVGINQLKSNEYDLIISDIMMPEMDGFEFLEYLRKKELKTPVIITTGFSTLENAVKSLASGAIDYLPKPFTIDELISVVKRGLEYTKIINSIDTFKIEDHEINDSIPFIPCPAQYNRLGYFTWAFVEYDGSVKIGLTDLLLRTIESIDEFELFDIDSEIYQGSSCCTIKTEDQLSHNILSPISGRIIDKNVLILNEKNLIEKDPYFRGWLYRLIPDNLEYESQHLMPCSSDM